MDKNKINREVSQRAFVIFRHSFIHFHSVVLNISYVYHYSSLAYASSVHYNLLVIIVPSHPPPPPRSLCQTFFFITLWRIHPESSSFTALFQLIYARLSCCCSSSSHPPLYRIIMYSMCITYFKIRILNNVNAIFLSVCSSYSACFQLHIATL